MMRWMRDVKAFRRQLIPNLHGVDKALITRIRAYRFHSQSEIRKEP